METSKWESLYNELTKILLDVTQKREGWVDCNYLYLKMAFDKVLSQETALETRKCWRIEGKLFEQQI